MLTTLNNVRFDTETVSLRSTQKSPFFQSISLNLPLVVKTFVRYHWTKKVSSYSWVCPCRVSHTLSQWIIETGDRFAQPHHSYVLHMHKLLCTQRLCSRTLHFDEIENFIRLLCTREQTNHRWHVWFFFCLCFCRTNCVFGILRAFFGRKPSLHIHTHTNTKKWRFIMIRFYLYCAINFNS